MFSGVQTSQGLDCSEPGSSIQALPILPGYWRESLSSVTVRECFNEVKQRNSVRVFVRTILLASNCFGGMLFLVPRCLKKIGVAVVCLVPRHASVTAPALPYVTFPSFKRCSLVANRTPCRIVCGIVPFTPDAQCRHRVVGVSKL